MTDFERNVKKQKRIKTNILEYPVNLWDFAENLILAGKIKGQAQVFPKNPYYDGLKWFGVSSPDTLVIDIFLFFQW